MWVRFYRVTFPRVEPSIWERVSNHWRGRRCRCSSYTRAKWCDDRLDQPIELEVERCCNHSPWGLDRANLMCGLGPVLKTRSVEELRQFLADFAIQQSWCPRCSQGCLGWTRSSRHRKMAPLSRYCARSFWKTMRFNGLGFAIEQRCNCCDFSEDDGLRHRFPCVLMSMLCRSRDVMRNCFALPRSVSGEICFWSAA